MYSPIENTRLVRPGALLWFVSLQKIELAQSSVAAILDQRKEQGGARAHGAVTGVMGDLVIEKPVAKLKSINYSDKFLAE
jgi:hypothetical protein